MATAPSISASLSGRLDNSFLVEEINRETEKLDFVSPERRLSDEELAFVVLNTYLSKRNRWSPETLFDERKITAEEVSQFSVDQLLKMPIVEYLSIIDLISGKQCMTLLKTASQAQAMRKWALFFYNVNIGVVCGNRLYQRIVEQAISPEVIARADKLFKRLSEQPYSPEAMQRLQEDDVYRALEQSRIQININTTDQPPKKVSLESDKYERWKAVNQRYLAQGCPDQFDLYFLTELNNSLRTDSLPRGVRKVGEEMMLTEGGGNHAIPGRQAKKELDRYVLWINQEILLCDQQLSNPILLSGRAKAWFRAIHGYHDGHKGESKMIADLILRRYHLLPVAWGRTNLAPNMVAIDRIKKDTMTHWVDSILDGLEASYEICQINLELPKHAGEKV